MKRTGGRHAGRTRAMPFRGLRAAAPAHRCFLRTAAPALAAILLLPATAAPQVVPGGDGRPAAQLVRSEFYSYMLAHTDTTFMAWRRSWQGQDERAAAALYTEDGVVQLAESGVLLGRQGIGDALGGLLREVGDVRVALGDFEASGRMAYRFGPYEVHPPGVDPEALDAGSPVVLSDLTREPERGYLFSVLRRPGDEWRMRAQLFVSADPFLTGGRIDSAQQLSPMGVAMVSEARGPFARGVFGAAESTLAAWRSAWGRNDADALGELLVEGALLSLPDGEPVQQSGAVRERVASWMGRSADLSSAITDFEASGRMAYLMGRYHLEGDGDSMGRSWTGPFAAILFRDDEVWKIRALVMGTDPAG